MTIDDKNIIWLDLFEFLSYQKKDKILKCFEKGQDIRKLFTSTPKIREILTNEEYFKMSVKLTDEFLALKISNYEKDNIHCITIYNENYPYLLRQISTPPFCLYCKGNLQLLDTDCIGVVGTRHPSDYGIVTTNQFVDTLANHDLTIVSGMAIGIDTFAHRKTLEKQGKTIAVLAGGFNHIYPISNMKLSREILENNLLITENAPDTLPLAYLFLARNRIIAGLSKGILITEAGEKSGALNTCNYALEYNREVFAVPGKINSPMSKGTNKLIKNMQANIALSADDILEALNIEKEKINANLGIQLDINAQIVLNYIQTEKKTFQQIADFTKFSASELNTILLELELNGFVTKLANNSYIAS